MDVGVTTMMMASNAAQREGNKALCRRCLLPVHQKLMFLSHKESGKQQRNPLTQLSRTCCRAGNYPNASSIFAVKTTDMPKEPMNLLSKSILVTNFKTNG